MAQVELTVIEQSGVEVTVLDAPGAQVAIGPTLSTATPQAVGLTGAAGTSSSASKADHSHAHGNQTGTSLHALASGSGAGFMSAAQFSLLDGATAAAVVSSLVRRDASGNFAANLIDADLDGNAATATKLATARAINGVSFDGTNNITITAAPTASSVVNASVASNAAIALSKLATGALPTAITVASANLVDGTIVNADINASAAIALTKLAAVTAGRVVMGNASNVATVTEITGDATLASTGVLTLSNSGVSAATVNNAATSVTPLTIDAKGRITGTGSPVTITPSYNSLTGLPTTLAGYGITDAVGSGATAGRVLLGNSSNLVAATEVTGDVTINSSGVTAIGSGVIVNADVSASAAIAHSKLASITAGQVLLGNASNVATATALSGDVTISSSGVTAIGTGVIVDADINASAAIALSKLATGALPTAITVASANIVDGTIVNADVNASAAIAGSKIAPDFGAQNVLTTGTITGASLNPTGTTVPAAGLFRPATNVIGWATNTLERARISPGGALLVGATAEPIGQISGTVVANNKLIIGAGNHGTSQRYAAGSTTSVTATTGTIVFKFKSAGSSVQRAALIKLSITHFAASNAATSFPAAEYAFRIFNTDAGVCAIAGATTIMEYQYVRATHLAFADLGSGECTVTLTNPTAVTLFGTQYSVEILTPGLWFLDTVITT
jgi:sporulation protein YlmC with PRC-barrel domain